MGIAFIPQSTWIFNKKDNDANRYEFKYQPTFGYAAQLKIGYNFAPPIGIHTGLIYSKQGQRHTAHDSLGVLHKNVRDLQYLKIPLLIHINGPTGPVMFTFGLGAFYGILLDGDHQEDKMPKFAVSNPKNLFRKWDMGAIFYIGADVQLVEDLMYLNLRLQGDYSFFNMENKAALSDSGTEIYKFERGRATNFNMGLNIGLTFVFLPEGGGKRVGFWR